MKRIIMSLLLWPLLAESATTTIFLSRHAEKASQASDPELTTAGRCRADFIASLLSEVEIDRIYSSDYRRTRQTIAPLADSHELIVELYDPRQLETLADILKTTSGNTFVAGHSNTTPQLVRLLGGTAEDMDETDYSRLYQIQISGDEITTHLLTLPAGNITSFCENTES